MCRFASQSMKQISAVCGMRWLKRAFVWLTRIGRSRGFGIQSPNDYQYVRYVINEHSPYYKYADLKNTMADINPMKRKLCELYFRVANDCQPDLFLDFMPDSEAYAIYVKAGCERTRTVTVNSTSQLHLTADDGRMMVRMDAVEKGWISLELLLEDVPDGSVIALQGIYDSEDAKEIWQKAMAHERVGVAYDLYDCGLLLFEPRQYKKNYKVNF